MHLCLRRETSAYGTDQAEGLGASFAGSPSAVTSHDEVVHLRCPKSQE